MVIKVYIEKTGETLTKEFGEFKTAKDLVKSLNENINGVLISVNSQIVLEDYEICDNDFIEILSVVSGG